MLNLLRLFVLDIDINVNKFSLCGIDCGFVCACMVCAFWAEVLPQLVINTRLAPLKSLPFIFL